VLIVDTDFLLSSMDVVVVTFPTVSRSVNSCLVSLSLGFSRLKDSDFDPYEEEQKRKQQPKRTPPVVPLVHKRTAYQP
jgi:hypothetical protein